MINFWLRKFNSNRQQGFTLVEMLVAVSIFVIVAFIVISTLLTMSYAYKRAQKMRLLMDNLGFSIQSMSLNIREGVDYSQPNCSDQSCFQFRPLDSWLDNGFETVCYDRYLREDGSGTSGIKKCSACPCSDEIGSDIVSPEIDILSLKFEESVDLNWGARAVKIIISGTAGKNREKTDFLIQNTVSQRNPN